MLSAKVEEEKQNQLKHARVYKLHAFRSKAALRDHRRGNEASDNQP